MKFSTKLGSTVAALVLVLLATGCNFTAEEITTGSAPEAVACQLVPTATPGGPSSSASTTKGERCPPDQPVNSPYSMEQLSTGHFIRCYEAIVDDLLFTNYPARGERSVAYVEIDPTKVTAASPGEIDTALGPVVFDARSEGQLLALNTEPMLVSIDQDSRAFMFFEAVQAEGGEHVWVLVTFCGLSPYEAILQYLQEAGRPQTLVNATEAFFALLGRDGSESLTTQEELVEWATPPEPEPRIEWADEDPSVRQFEDAPPGAGIVGAMASVRLPESWLTDAAGIVCLHTRSGWSGCSTTNAIDSESNAAIGLELFGYRMPGEDVSIVLLNGEFDFEGPSVELGVIEGKWFDGTEIPMLTIDTDSSPQQVLDGAGYTTR